MKCEAIWRYRTDDALLTDRVKTNNKQVPRNDEEAAATATNKYAQQSFPMFGGGKQKVELRFQNRMLGAVLDCVGRSAVVYKKEDEKHFVMTSDVEVSEHFYGWLLGFGRNAQLVNLTTAVNAFCAYLNNVRDLYESC